jgi:hypothetical protein
VDTSINFEVSENPKPSDGLPHILYKYRNWGSTYNQRLITEREVYFSSASEFNDPFDARFPIRYDLVGDSELKDRLRRSYKQGFPLAGHSLVEAEVNRAFDNLRNPVYLEELYERKYQANSEVIGVFSMAERSDNILMWSHYANYHKGFVAGFDTDILFHNMSPTILRVTYQDEYPIIMPGLGTDEGALELAQVYSVKSSLWSYEEEVRMFKMHAAGKAFIYQPEALREIIFGCKISSAHRSEMLALAPSFPNAKFYDAKMDSRAFKLNIIPV